MFAKHLITHIFTPHQQPTMELMKRFVVNLGLLKAVQDALPHYLSKQFVRPYIFVGERGCGKTSLLLRIEQYIEQSPLLKPHIIPVTLSEEQPGINDLYALWELAAEHMAEKHEGFGGLTRKMDKLYEGNVLKHARVCLSVLSNALKEAGKQLILLIDNIPALIKKMSSEEKRLFVELLNSNPNIRVIGTALRIPVGFKKNASPFRDFFDYHYFQELSFEQVKQLYKRLGEECNKPIIAKITQEQPGRIEAMRRLSGGNLRAMIVLFELLISNPDGNTKQDLYMLLDRLSPIYKQWIDDLPGQQQQIMHTMGLRCDGISTKDIAEKTRLQSKKVSAQLKQLQDDINTLVKKIPTHIKNHLYQFDNRFFNTWYMMRYGHKRHRQEVLWLTDFMEKWAQRKSFLPYIPFFIAHDDQLVQKAKEYNIEAMAALAWKDYTEKSNASEALHYANIVAEQEPSTIHQYLLAIVQLWNEENRKSIDTAKKSFLYDPNFLNQSPSALAEYLLLLLKKKEYNFLWNYFTGKNSRALQLKARFKCLYYALVHFMQDSRPVEYRKMGNEMKETVHEIMTMVQ